MGRSLLRPYFWQSQFPRRSSASFDFDIQKFQTELMDPLREFGRALLILGAVSVVVGALFFFGARLPFRLGRLPGDIIHRGEHTTFYFPIVTSLVHQHSAFDSVLAFL